MTYGVINCLLHVVCHYALGDREKMRKTFPKLLEQSEIVGIAKHVPVEEEEETALALVGEAIRNDALRHFDRDRKHEQEWCIMTAAKL